MLQICANNNKQLQETEKTLRSRSAEKDRDLKSLESETTSLHNQIRALKEEKITIKQKLTETSQAQQESSALLLKQRDTEIIQLRTKLQERSAQYQSLRDQLSDMETQLV